MAISTKRFDQSAWNLTRWCILVFRRKPAVKIANFSKSKMADDCYLENSKNSHIPTAVWNLSRWRTFALRTGLDWKVRTFKNTRRGMAAILKIEKWRYLRNSLSDRHKLWHDNAHWPSEPDRPFENRNISATGWPIARRYGMMTTLAQSTLLCHPYTTLTILRNRTAKIIFDNWIKCMIGAKFGTY